MSRTHTTDMIPLDLTCHLLDQEDHHTIDHMKVMATHHTMEGIFGTGDMADPLGWDTEEEEAIGDLPEDRQITGDQGEHTEGTHHTTTQE